jgi:integrase
MPDQFEILSLCLLNRSRICALVSPSGFLSQPPGLETGSRWRRPNRCSRCPIARPTKGKRDRALLCLLIGCGLRREELALLTIEHIQQRDARWVLVDLVGKGSRIRTVPMPAWTKLAIDQWVTGAGIGDGRLLRAVNKGDRIVGVGMTAQSIFEVVERYGQRIGLQIAPHDLRRTFAKLAHKGHAALEQIQISLGHASIQTTERYLGIEQDLTDAPCDHLGLRV